MEYRTRSGWYYVGHGQLRFMDAEGWTDRYRSIDNPPRKMAAEQFAPVAAVPADQEAAAKPDRRVMAWFVAGAVTAVLAVIAGAPRALVALYEQSAEVLAPAPMAQGGPAEGVVAAPLASSEATSPTSPTSSATATSTSATSSDSPTSSAPASPTPASPTLSASASPTPLVSPSPVAGTFNRQRALAKAADIMGDIQIVDYSLAEGVDVNSALTLLSRSYGRLAETGVPPDVDRSDYVLRVTSLQALTLQAAEGYDDDRTQAVSTYSAARSETRVLFQQLNDALGSNLSLP
jgi:hypothetical protein